MVSGQFITIFLGSYRDVSASCMYVLVGAPPTAIIEIDTCKVIKAIRLSLEYIDGSLFPVSFKHLSVVVVRSNYAKIPASSVPKYLQLLLIILSTLF